MISQNGGSSCMRALYYFYRIRTRLSFTSTASTLSLLKAMADRDSSTAGTAGVERSLLRGRIYSSTNQIQAREVSGKQNGEWAPERVAASRGVSFSLPALRHSEEFHAKSLHGSGEGMHWNIWEPNRNSRTVASRVKTMTSVLKFKARCLLVSFTSQTQPTTAWIMHLDTKSDPW